MKFNIIGITGLHTDQAGNTRTVGAGKDAAADVLVSIGYVKVGLADPLKRICKEVYNFSDEQLWGPSALRDTPDFRYPRGAQQYRDAYDREAAVSLEHESAGRLDAAASARANAVAWATQGWLTPRLALQLLGTEWGRHCYDNTWMEYAIRIAKELSTGVYTYTQQAGLVLADGRVKPPIGVVFSDIRFFNEYDAIKAVGGKVVRVKRQYAAVFPPGTDATHTSERQLPTYDDGKFDYIIDNSGDLHMLSMLTRRMDDVLRGMLMDFDEANVDVPPCLRS